MRVGRIFGAVLLICGLMGAASSTLACSIREPVNREAAWAAYRSEARTIFIGQVVALHPYSRTERRELDAQRIAGVSYGTSAGWADVAPVESVFGQADAVRARYSNGSGCGRDLWHPALGDFVLVVVGENGFADVLSQRDVEDPVLQAHVQNYW